ncbi:hypothetical protein [Hyalangium gracile]|uniref:hypothetical protein n=1 Tax=Hyalangium gracile TaxID=394092 RepID=UPI001CCA4274|nr:hypothetical protein [Hyalangium gracile]
MSRIVWFILWGFIGVLVLLVVLTLMDPWLFQVPWHLATGWVAFILRVFPQITWRWGGIAQTAVVVAGLGVGTHYFLRWLWRQRHAQQDGAPEWPARWSVSLVALLVLLFLATMSTVGIGHHVGWLASSRDPLTKSSWSFMAHTLSGESDSADLCEATLELVKKGVADADLNRALLQAQSSRAMMETRHVVPLRKPGGDPGFLIFSRDPLERERTGLLPCEPNSGSTRRERYPASLLPRLLAGEPLPVAQEK